MPSLAILLLVLLRLAAGAAEAYRPPDVRALHAASPADLRAVIEHYAEDSLLFGRYYPTPLSETRLGAMEKFQRAWLEELARVDFDRLDLHGRVDYALFRNHLERQLARLAEERKRIDEMRGLVPFRGDIVELQERRQRVEDIEGEAAAAKIDALRRRVEGLPKEVEKLGSKPPVLRRAAAAVEGLRALLKDWYGFYAGYDPLLTWWVKNPYTRADKALGAYTEALRKLAGADDKDTIIGDPIGRDALIAELKAELIPYTPEELVEIANREFAWCDAEMLKASRELGFGDDWKRALEHVKRKFVPPGKQTALVRDLAWQAIEFVEKNNMVTVPAGARDTWRMTMMSPERQRLNPFFLGGETITVSYPTDDMTHDEKMMSMRGNNPHFSHATVFHELIPGHWLQRYMNLRHRPYRRVFSTPFWTEGWALYWEMVMWDRGFHATPEDRAGALFWRMHRCARIVFSLSFHLGKMTPGEAVDYLVNRVGHEPENARAEVRRSFESNYAPLYQAAYMLGGLQLRALRGELVDAGKMTERAFHDEILKLNSIPIAMVRATLLKQVPAREARVDWRF